MKLFTDPDAPRQPGERQFELDGWIDSSPFETLIGLKIVTAADGTATLTLPFTVKLANGGGVMHGGALTTLADTAVAMAMKSLLPAGTVFATTDLAVKFLEPVVSGTVRADARIDSTEDRLFRGSCELRGCDNVLFARFSSVFKVARQQK